MNKSTLLVGSICILLVVANKASAAAPNQPQPIDATTAQAYIANYKNNVTNKFAEFYALDLNAISGLVNSGAKAVRIYNGIVGDGSKTAIIVPLDASFNNMTGGSQMPAMAGVWVCPPNCDVTRSGATASMMATPSAQTAAGAYNTNGSFESFNAFIVYPQAITALRTGGAVNIQICNATNTTTGVRCIIYRGVNAAGTAAYLMEDVTNLCNNCTL